jgi:hypothetical protein
MLGAVIAPARFGIVSAVTATRATNMTTAVFERRRQRT